MSYSHPGAIRLRRRSGRKKKPTWQNTLRCFVTSAYSLTSPPEEPGCRLFSHPTTLVLAHLRCEEPLHDSHATRATRPSRSAAAPIGGPGASLDRIDAA